MILSANPPPLRSRLILLQSITFVWMLIECTVSLISAARAHSPALLAFGCDSFVELLSAALVVFSLAPRFQFNHKRVDAASGALLFLLAAVVAVTSLLALAHKLQPQSSPLGTVAALFVMPLLARQKRTLARITSNNVLAADAVQSATCAYLAAIALAGLALNAGFHIVWADSAAALAIVPILIIEGRRAMRGQSCGCC
jgi:divalent metal cation (Fe/Co/Zn/Cd) transporter